MIDQRLAAFCEYVMRPMTEDIRLILQELSSLKIGISQDTIKSITLTLGLWHLASELIRAFCYIGVTAVICYTLVQVWPLL